MVRQRDAGCGDVQLEVDNARQAPYAMELVRQAFAAQAAGPRQGERRLADSWEGSRGLLFGIAA